MDRESHLWIQKNTLTDRQRAIVDWVRAYFADLGYYPSFREIQNHFKIKSPNAVAGHLDALDKKGVLKHARNSQGRAKCRAFIFNEEEYTRLERVRHENSHPRT